ncbi:pterocarpan synthase 1-like [Vigna umbellata]|uniref:pterocarpan synthase 1-like n=1 Tax=Vigna umbellata TaxID=87088 RepID=UPI001F5F66E8|nr:pterocarpan synthase 1-like [Vigna umbellata]
MRRSNQHIMASSHNYVLGVLVFAIIQLKGIAGSHEHLQQLKSLHFSLFQHETINKTGYIIVDGIKGGAGVSQTTTPFGTLFAFQDPLTVAANRSSKLVGISEGTTVTSSLDGLRSISIAKLTLRLKNHKGSLSVVGVTDNVKSSNLPVVGGTEDFLFVHGYVTSSPLHAKSSTLVYEIGFHLYWPPYATTSS